MCSRYLCREIIFNILLHIPARSLHRFRHVSKQWFQIIADPLFVQAHLAKSKPALLFASPLYSDQHKPTSQYRVVDDNREGGIDVQALTWPSMATTVVLGSCNGLFLVRDAMPGRGIGVLNPVTGKYLALPNFITGTVTNMGGGIGFDPRSNEYKAVVLYRSRSCQPHCRRFHCRILTIKSGAGGQMMTWKRLRCTLRSFHYFWPPVLANTSLHWISVDCKYLIALDIGGNAEFRRIELPPTNLRSLFRGDQHLMSNGKRLFFGTRCRSDSDYEMWRLDGKHNEENWIREGTIEHGLEPRRAYMIVGILRDEKTVIFKKGGVPPWDYIAFDRSHGKVTRFSVMGDPGIGDFTMAHVNSLASWYKLPITYMLI